MKSLVLLVGLLLLLASCLNTEGDEVGECTDRADNDRDGLFDCDDPDCFGSPACSGDDDSGGDDDDAGDDDTAMPDDDTAMPDDDTAMPDDDTAMPDDDTEDGASYSGTVEMNLTSVSWPLDDVACVGEVSGVLGATALVGSGSCWTDAWMLEVELPLDFACSVAGGQLEGAGSLYMDAASSGLLPDETFALTGSYSETNQQIEATLDNDPSGDVDVEIDGALWMSPLSVEPG